MEVIVQVAAITLLFFCGRGENFKESTVKWVDETITEVVNESCRKVVDNSNNSFYNEIPPRKNGWRQEQKNDEK